MQIASVRFCQFRGSIAHRTNYIRQLHLIAQLIDEALGAYLVITAEAKHQSREVIDFWLQTAILTLAGFHLIKIYL